MADQQEWTMKEELSKAICELRKQYDALLVRWQTLDDLTQILIEKFSLPAEKLRELAAKYPPPQSWFEETADPFSAD
jgi:hypothetical protein